MSNNSLQLATDFNTILLDFATNIADVCPNSLIGKNINDIRKAINNHENKTKFVEFFVTKILVYKEQIDVGDERFFLGKSYEKDFEGNESSMHHIFEFKSIWGKLSPENRGLVIQYMQILAQLAQDYFMAVYG